MAKRRRNPGRRYSDEDRANALAALSANNGNYKLTSRLIGIPEATLRDWARGRRHPEATTSAGRARGTLADELERVAWELSGMLPSRIESASLQHLAIALGITIDKMQLLRNKPTAISREQVVDDDLQQLTDEELEAQLAAARSRADSPGSTSPGSSTPGDGATGEGAEPPPGGTGPDKP